MRIIPQAGGAHRAIGGPTDLPAVVLDPCPVIRGSSFFLFPGAMALEYYFSGNNQRSRLRRHHLRAVARFINR